MNFSMFPLKLKMKSLVVLVFAVVALSVMECSVAGTKFGFFFAHLHLLTSQGTNHHLSLKAGGGGGGCVRSPWILILPQKKLPDPVKLYSILMIPPHWWSVFCSSPFQKL